MQDANSTYAAESGSLPRHALSAADRTVPLTDAFSDRAQALRGLACLLLVAFHVIVDNSVKGMDDVGTSAFVSAARVFAPIRMPLFMFLAGFVYAYRPVSSGTHRTFVRKKLWRLFVPFMFVSTLFFLFQYVAGEPLALRDIWRSYVFTYAHFWFMQSLMIILLLVVVLERGRALGDVSRFATVFSVALLAHFFILFDVNVFSINQALYLLPFFLLGLGANRFRQAISSNRFKIAVATVFGVCMLFHVLACFHLYGPTLGPRAPLWTAISITGTLLLLWWMPSPRWLQALGAFSFAIYLHHVFFTMGARFMLAELGVTTGRLAYFLTALAFGILGPILLERTIARYGLARRLLLGRA
jgi:peptidoglycan/LPS O-acetylase OafA/YrhL